MRLQALRFALAPQTEPAPPTRGLMDQMMRRTLVGFAALAILATLATLWFHRYARQIALTSVELNQPVHSPKAPPRLIEGCPEVRLALALSSRPLVPENRKPIKNNTPLSKDEIAIYRAVLEQWTDGEHASLNISGETFPLDLADRLGGLAGCDCVRDIYFENFSNG